MTRMVSTTGIAIVDAAKEANRYFVSRERNNGERFITLRDDRPDWVQELTYKAHMDGTEFGMLPDDVRYAMIAEAVNAIAGADLSNDWENQIGDVDAEFSSQEIIYTRDLLVWLHSRLDRYSYCDEYVEEMGAPFGDGGVLDQIRGGIYMERREVFAAVSNALIEHIGQN